MYWYFEKLEICLDSIFLPQNLKYDKINLTFNTIKQSGVLNDDWKTSY